MRARNIEQLAAERRAAKLSQAQVAQLVGKSTSWISQLEAGGLEATEEQVLRYEKALRTLQLLRLEGVA